MPIQRRSISAFINSRFFVALFATLTIAFGGLWMAHTQMNRIPDLWEHVYRVSGIVNGDIVARPVDSISGYHRDAQYNYGGKVDWQWIELSTQHNDPSFDAGVVNLDSITANDSTGADVPYNNTAVYSPVSYVPQIIGFGVGKALNLNAATTYYLTEGIMLLVYAALTACGIAALQRWRLPTALLLLSPPVIYHFSFAISADSLTQGLIILFSCLLMRAASCPPQWLDYAIIGSIGILIALTKFAFMPLIFIPAALLIVHKSTSRQERLTVAASIALSFAAVFAWLKMTAAFVSNPASVSPAEVHARTSGLLHDPRPAINALWYSFSHLQGHFRSPLMLLAIWLFFGLVLLAILGNAIVKPRHWRESLFWLIVFIMAMGTILATYLAIMWLQGTPSSMSGVYTPQLRYFVPLFPMMLLAGLENGARLLGKRRSARAVTACS
ncbi:DUF2142 domain-containing protein [Bifidobacterium sp. LC6]|uniref:DUF2142 domain-containing protein n=1 Tax=Bifidobacterium colobi TaxID=2809026 RepID=A0ABS5UX38_9BIFI|nr:DUF2142 domain-containing protein [Bifidobacterium colobi]MBT1175662.1 DUF2142 domain-containing protein [Bifidobacterium colobi]